MATMLLMHTTCVLAVDVWSPRARLKGPGYTELNVYCQAGDVINDHDIALAYVLDHFPDLLPSFAMLPPEQQKSVRFTQSKMGFNHGWLVQAEAPPSALFAQFKKIVSAGEIVPQAFMLLITLTTLMPGSA